MGECWQSNFIVSMSIGLCLPDFSDFLDEDEERKRATRAADIVVLFVKDRARHGHLNVEETHILSDLRMSSSDLRTSTSGGETSTRPTRGVLAGLKIHE